VVSYVTVTAFSEPAFWGFGKGNASNAIKYWALPPAEKEETEAPEPPPKRLRPDDLSAIGEVLQRTLSAGESGTDGGRVQHSIWRNFLICTATTYQYY
jgi:hypothetical protein